MNSKNQKVKEKLLDGYLATSQVLSPSEFNHGKLLEIIFRHMANEISDVITKRNDELPKEDCVFCLTCKMYKFDDYKKAHPKVFKKEVK